jgi:hypothetical protein
VTEQTPEGQPSPLRTIIEKIKQDAGGDLEIARQSVADVNALQRPEARNHFEARLEYVRQVAENDRAAFKGLVEDGLQTLKWSFFLNAGAIAIVVAYVGSGLGRSANGSLSSFAPLLKALWPFAIGCLMVTLAGAGGYFNFCYAPTSLPSAETLHQFMSPAAASWPPPPNSSNKTKRLSIF